MKRKVVRKRSRRQKALMAMAWFAFLVALNLIFNVVAMFPFQARQEMENRMEIDQTEMIWKASEKSRDGYTNCLTVNEDVAVFTNYRLYWNRGWIFDRVVLIPRNTEEAVYARYLNIGNNEYREEHYMGYVKSDEVAAIEYFYRWDDGVVRSVKIEEDSFICHNGERYYWQVEIDGDPIWKHPAINENLNYTVAVDLLETAVRALDRDGNVIYQGPIKD